MAGRINEEDIATVRERSRIEDVVGGYVALRNAGGGSLKGLCPFHDEKTPSFQVTPSRGFYYCFGCGEGGDVITFLQRQQNLSFVEAIEVLAIGLTRPYADGRPLGMVLEELSREDLLLILPWGVGKWLGQRGRIIADAVDGWRGDQLFLGDNGNRPFFWPLPPVFAAGQRGRCRNLPGSDPLPLAGEEGQAGRCGFWCEGVVDADRPFASVAALLRDPVTALHPYGAGETAYRVCRNQLLLRLAR